MPAPPAHAQAALHLSPSVVLAAKVLLAWQTVLIEAVH